MTIADRLSHMEQMLKELLGRQAEREGYLDIRRAAKYASTSPDTVRRWIAEGRLPAYRPDKKIFVKRAALDQLMELSKIDYADINEIVAKTMKEIL